MEEYKIMFLRSKDHNHPVGCIAIRLRGIKHDNVDIQYQLSTLSPTDRFDRKLARQLALGRLIESPITVSNVNASTIHHLVKAIMQHISESFVFPKRSKAAAKHWLSTKGKLV